VSNLTVSYVSQTPAGTPAGASAAAPATDSPLAFLAALIDQLFAGGAEAEAATEAGANVDVAGLLDLALSSKTETEAEAPDLLAALAAQLDRLQTQFTTGEPPPPDQLQTLREAIDALTAAIDGAPQTGLVPVETGSSPTAALRDQLLALGQTLAATAPDLSQKLQALATKLEVLTRPDADAATIAQIIRTLLGHAAASSEDDGIKIDPAAAPTANPGPQLQDDLLQILATLGLNTPPATTAPTNVQSASATAAPTAVPADLLRLSTQLSHVASELAATAPDLAKKLEAVATRLVSADAGPDLLAKLTGAASQSDGTALDKLVQSLIEAKPITTPPPVAPQIAAATLPAPVAPKQSKSVVTEVKAAPPEPAPVTADSAPKPAPAITLATREQAADTTPEPKVEAKVAAIVADATKADPATQPAQAPTAPAQQVRALPAAYQPVANPINMGQVAFEMVRQVHQGTSRFTIRLDPPEMGRVDVRMQVDANGTVNARLTVDRAETLDLFQRDRQSLERALSQAGLDAGKTNLEFSLRQQNHNPFAGMMGGDQHQQQGFGGAPRYAPAGTDEAAPPPAITLYRGTASAGGVNIFA
jgi:flagellar hook-length control protein FliK